jgi:triosephosphate isomerase (TIM)
MARKGFVVGNWKMNLLVEPAELLARGIREQLKGFDGADAGVCPTFVAIPAVANILKGSNIRLGAQNCHQKNDGAFTGEIAAPMLKDIGCRHVILGHSERRHIFGETDAVINLKIQAALAAGLDPIICVGETLDERQAQRTEEVVGHQINTALEGMAESAFPRLTVAYEPVWAIGTGVNASPAQAQEVHKFLRAQVAAKFGRAIAEALRIQYGGSVKADNAKELMSQPDVDGALVGGAALKVDSFVAIVRAAAK